uniref:transposase n=1 Tax=Klebsiella pneumoniae TaxID=573 RepID=UPI0009BBF29C|nr:transposase [Klebsiella pneumoniae]
MKDQITHLPDNADRSVAKQKFKITNWPTYNKDLINRGSITFWLDDEAIRAVANQRMTGSNARWKWTTDYNRRSIAETAMYRVKQLFGGSLTLRDYDGQVAEAMALVRALNKMTKAGMPESVRIA